MEKKRYDLEIAGVEMAVISDEREEFVRRLASELDAGINAITGANKRCSKLDAALLCALDYASDKIKAEKRVRNLEAQVALYDANLRRMKEENARLKGESFVCAAPRDVVEEVAEEVAEETTENELEVEIIEETAAAVQLGIVEEEPEVVEEAPAVPEKREDKLRLIENLLKNRGN